MKNPLRVFGFLYSRFCVARCDHCGSSSGSDVRGTLPMEYVIRCLDDLGAFGIASVVITGGEPLAFFADVCQIMELARDRGIGVQVCTNGFWARDPRRAHDRVAALASRGLQRLMLSTDRFHTRFVPVEAVINAANAAAESGIPCQIAVPSLARDWVSLALLTRLRVETSATVFTHPIHPIGRGEGLPSHQMALGPLVAEGCPLVGHVEVDVDGTVSCCPTSADFDRASPLVLGNVGREPLQDILTRFQTTPLFRIIAAYGAVGLLLLLEARGVTHGSEGGRFLHVCHLCRALNSSPALFQEFQRRTGMDLLAPMDGETFAALATHLDTILDDLASAPARRPAVAPAIAPRSTTACA